ncbi:MAG: FAD-dependent thymidylate synthase, partial [Anaerolineae bacterium]|nr:FAD-dependent thymidylate synthase [Anaerolineae bacterium]
SPFEMVEFKFRLRAPLVTFWQLVRHRTANLNMQSGRYTPFEENDFYVPSVWRKQAKSNKQASEGELEPEAGALLTEKLIRHYEQGYKLYTEALETGVSKEMARLFLPGFSVYYTCVWKIDCHNLLHFLSLRMAEDAQYEIRIYAQTIYEQFFKPALPWTAEAFEQYVLKA